MYIKGMEICIVLWMYGIGTQDQELASIWKGNCISCYEIYYFEKQVPLIRAYLS